MVLNVETSVKWRVIIGGGLLKFSGGFFCNFFFNLVLKDD